MPIHSKKPSPSQQLIQLLVNFVIPIIILSKYSNESQLGPTKAMVLALAFPVVFELYSIYRNRKVSVLSMVAIGGILVTGAISLLGLSENWLAARRSIPYFAGAAALLFSVAINRPLVEWLLKSILDIDTVRSALTRNNNEEAFQNLLKTTSYLLGALCILIGMIALISTKLVITGATNTELFNAEYARLRVLSVAYITVPLLVGFIGTVMYLLMALEKLTGLPLDQLMKKKD